MLEEQNWPLGLRQQLTDEPLLHHHAEPELNK